MDCRDTGLGWILKNLTIIMSSNNQSYDNDINHPTNNNSNIHISNIINNQNSNANIIHSQNSNIHNHK